MPVFLVKKLLMAPHRRSGQQDHVGYFGAPDVDTLLLFLTYPGFKHQYRVKQVEKAPDWATVHHFRFGKKNPSGPEPTQAEIKKYGYVRAKIRAHKKGGAKRKPSSPSGSWPESLGHGTTLDSSTATRASYSGVEYQEGVTVSKVKAGWKVHLRDGGGSSDVIVTFTAKKSALDSIRDLSIWDLA